MIEQNIPTTRAAAMPDVRALSVTLAKAFFDDPVISWILPDDRSRKARSGIMFDTLARHAHVPHGGAELIERGDSVGSAALWDPPGEWRLPLRTQARQFPAFLRAFGTRLPVAISVLTAIERHHPAEPHWYLAIIGTDPAAQGLGLGGALMRSRLDRCDRDGIPAYLESSKDSNVPYYEKFGFRVTRELALPGGGPPVWLMWRDPQ